MELQCTAIATHLFEDGCGTLLHRRVSKNKYTSGNKVVWNEVNGADRSAMFSHINFETVINMFETI